MSGVCKFKELLSDDIVSELFHKREDSISNRTLEEREQIKQLLNKNNKDYENILIAIDNVPEVFVETKKLIKKNVDTKLETLNEISAYDNEKFYKIGFYDGINLIIDCLKNK